MESFQTIPTTCVWHWMNITGLLQQLVKKYRFKMAVKAQFATKPVSSRPTRFKTGWPDSWLVKCNGPLPNRLDSFKTGWDRVDGFKTSWTASKHTGGYQCSSTWTTYSSILKIRTFEKFSARLRHYLILSCTATFRLLCRSRCMAVDNFIGLGVLEISV